MRVLVLAPGSTGDVLPYTGLGARLVADGHEVSIAANERFRPAVVAAGCGFRLLSGDPEEGNTTAEGRRWHDAGTGPRGQARMFRVLRDYVDQVSRDVVPAVEQGADLVLVNAVALFTGPDAAEGLGVPSAGVFPSPVHPSGDLPPAVLGLPSLGRPVNRLLNRLAVTGAPAPFGRTIAAVRERVGLPPVRSTSLWRRLEARRWPAFYGVSRALVTPPRDWPQEARITGTWWPHTPAGWAPDPGLEAFLDAGPPPVFVGLGSRAVGDPQRLATVIRDGLRRAGVRGVVQAGWAGLSIDDDDVLTVGDVPHEWLFPRTAAVAHHCGAGTTAAGLRAGVPTVGLPVLADQPYWASRLIAIGASPAALPLRRLTADAFAAAVSDAVRDDRYTDRARRAAEVMATEDGAGVVAAALPSLAT